MSTYQLIVGYNLISSFDFNKYESLQNTIGLTLELVWPLSTLLYALLSRGLKARVKEMKDGNGHAERSHGRFYQALNDYNERVCELWHCIQADARFYSNSQKD